MRAFIRGLLGLDWPYTPFTRSPHIYFIMVYLFRSTDDVSLSLIPLVHVVDQHGDTFTTHIYMPHENGSALMDLFAKHTMSNTYAVDLV